MNTETRNSIRHTLSLYGVPEAKEVLARLEQGRVSGIDYLANDCGCLLGSLHAARARETWAFSPRIAEAIGIVHNGPEWEATIEAQTHFLLINLGDTPATNPQAAEAHAVISEWIAEQEAPIASAVRCIPAVVKP